MSKNSLYSMGKCYNCGGGYNMANGGTNANWAMYPPQGQNNPANNTFVDQNPDKINFNATRAVSKMALSPQALSATGGLSALAEIPAIGYDIYENSIQKKKINDAKQSQENQVIQTQGFNSPYNQPGGYNQSFSEGGGMKPTIWDLASMDETQGDDDLLFNNNNNMKDGGGNWMAHAVNPKHKGYCTPMTKSTCTPHRKAFAMTMKKHHGFHGGHAMGGPSTEAGETRENDNDFDDMNPENYGIVPGNGAPKADDKQLVAEPGSFIVPADKVHVAKGILSLMGYNPDRKLDSMNQGGEQGGKGINISSKEMYLSPEMKEKMKNSAGMDEHAWEKAISPNSEHNLFYTMNSKKQQNPGNNHAGGGGIGDGFSDWFYNNIRSQKYRDNNYSASQNNQINSEVTPEDVKTPQQVMQDENDASRTFDYQAAYNPYNDPGAVQDQVGTYPDKTAVPAPATPPSQDDLFAQYNKSNRNLLAANEIASGGKALWNMLQKYTPSPKPQEYHPQQFNTNFNALEAEQKSIEQGAAATARYNARNENQTENTNIGIHANDLQAEQSNAAQIEGMRNQENLRNTELTNQATLYNLGNANQWREQNAQNQQAFRQQKAAAIGNNIDTALTALGQFDQGKFNALAIQKGMQVGDYGNRIFAKVKSGQQLTKEEADYVNQLMGTTYNPVQTGIK